MCCYVRLQKHIFLNCVSVDEPFPPPFQFLSILNQFMYHYLKSRQWPASYVISNTTWNVVLARRHIQNQIEQCSITKRIMGRRERRHLKYFVICDHLYAFGHGAVVTSLWGRQQVMEGGDTKDVKWAEEITRPFLCLTYRVTNSHLEMHTSFFHLGIFYPKT